MSNQASRLVGKGDWNSCRSGNSGCATPISRPQIKSGGGWETGTAVDEQVIMVVRRQSHVLRSNPEDDDVIGDGRSPAFHEDGDMGLKRYKCKRYSLPLGGDSMHLHRKTV
jgi:hypothetical protein